jgi:hypothetical protein
VWSTYKARARVVAKQRVGMLGTHVMKQRAIVGHHRLTHIAMYAGRHLTHRERSQIIVVVVGRVYGA